MISMMLFFLPESWGQRACRIADPEGNLIEISAFGGAAEVDAG